MPLFALLSFFPVHSLSDSPNLFAVILLSPFAAILMLFPFLILFPALLLSFAYLFPFLLQQNLIRYPLNYLFLKPKKMAVVFCSRKLYSSNHNSTYADQCKHQCVHYLFFHLISSKLILLFRKYNRFSL